ncbi:hypothetical protein [Halodesulfovibrio marinisediminis]|uniref:Uncharacterized protein n=1 Tax=Halodesulfovibrio marinisediminis DSM 17456 TaxID=1121457 RepID=A0A1N6EB26_9BACT|nr:hypothetical protein [Halodesulfovibrio marinisediminis]SIN80117.1 hypothetical protein SAMN02745161_0841 [Halodesulfovibrio marinisediminis DSM 17456]
MNKREKHSRNRKRHHRKARTQGKESIVESEASMIKDEVEHSLMDTHLQESFFDPHSFKDKDWLGLGPLGPKSRTTHSLIDIVREQKLRRHDVKIYWKAVKYEEGHLHPGEVIRKKDIIPPDRE